MRTAIERLLRREPVTGSREEGLGVKEDPKPPELVPPRPREAHDQVVKVVRFDEVLEELRAIHLLLKKLLEEAKE